MISSSNLVSLVDLFRATIPPHFSIYYNRSGIYYKCHRVSRRIASVVARVWGGAEGSQVDAPSGGT
jgi:hypothetical protein